MTTLEIILIAIILFIDYNMLKDMHSIIEAVMYGGCMVILIVYATILLYLFPVMTRQNLTFKDLIGRVGILATENLVVTIAMLTVAVLAGVAIANSPVLICVLPGFFCFFQSIFVERIFEKEIEGTGKES